MGLAEHFAVGFIGGAALAPCGDVVGVHFFQFPDAVLVGVVTDSAERAVGKAVSFGMVGLAFPDFALHYLIEHANLQEFGVGSPAEQEFKDTHLGANAGIIHEGFHLLPQIGGIVRLRVISLVQTPPFESGHLGQHSGKGRGRPVNHRIEVVDEFGNIRTLSVLRHVIFHITLAHPLQRFCQKILTIGRALDVGLPLLNLAVVAVGEHLLGFRHEGAGIDGVQRLLVVQGYTRDVDGLEPVLNLLLFAGAHIDEQFRVVQLLALLHGERGVVDRHAVGIHDGELARQETPDGGNALLSVQHFIFPCGRLVEIDKSDGIALQQRLNHRHILLAVRIDVVALILRLNRELAAPAEQALCFQFRILEALANLLNCNLCQKLCFHCA